MPDGQSRSSSRNPESEKYLERSAEKYVIVLRGPHTVPQGCDLGQEVHFEEVPVGPAVALSDAGWWGPAGGPCETDTVFSPPVF